MKRSSSKLIAKAGSMRNINKVGFKFRFDLQVESLDKLISANEVVITWERGAKIIATSPAAVDRSSRVANFGNELLTQEITLFKKKKEGSSFEDKVFKLTARAGSDNGKVIGRIEVNFAEYVDIPSFSKRVSAPLSNGGRLILRVSSTFIGEAKTRKGSHGSTSVGSSLFGGDDNASIDGEGAPDSPLGDNLIDIAISDDDVPAPTPPPVAPPAPPVNPTPTPARRGPMAGRRPSASSAEESTGSIGRSRGRGMSPRSREESAPRANSPATRTRPPARRVDSDMGTSTSGGSGGVPSRAEFDRLRKEARTLRRTNDDLVSRNQDLERRLEVALVGSGDVDENDRLSKENKSLRQFVEDLESQLRREPVYADVVRDLREAKMALAILTLEKDELMQEIRRLRR